MKIVTLLLLCFYLTLGVKGQSSLELAVYNELNKYRTKLSHTQWKPKKADSDYDSNVGFLCKLHLDKDVSQIANYHARYLSQVAALGLRNFSGEKAHDENIDVKNWAELGFSQRETMLKRINPEIASLTAEIQIQQLTVNKGTSDLEVAKKIISLFDQADGHKECMIHQFEEELVKPIVGVSVVLREGLNNNILHYSVVIDFSVIEIRTTFSK